MNFSVMSTAQRHGELVADLATKRARLHEGEMMGVRGLPTTDQAGLERHELEVPLVAVAPRFTDGEQALVDAIDGGCFGGLQAAARAMRTMAGARIGRATTVADFTGAF